MTRDKAKKIEQQSATLSFAEKAVGLFTAAAGLLTAIVVLITAVISFYSSQKIDKVESLVSKAYFSHKFRTVVRARNGVIRIVERNDVPDDQKIVLGNSVRVKSEQAGAGAIQNLEVGKTSIKLEHSKHWTPGNSTEVIFELLTPRFINERPLESVKFELAPMATTSDIEHHHDGGGELYMSIENLYTHEKPAIVFVKQTSPLKEGSEFREQVDSKTINLLHRDDSIK